MAPAIWLKLGRHDLPHKQTTLLIDRKNQTLINISFVAVDGSVPAEAPYQIILVHTKPPYKNFSREFQYIHFR